jgi:large subunit ribosomal protein L12
MEYIYAALLLHKLEQKIDEDAVKKVITSTGAKPDDVKIKALVSALSEVDIEDALKNAATTVTATAPAAAPTEVPAEAKTEEKKEEKDEKKDEEAMEGLASLFG